MKKAFKFLSLSTFSLMVLFFLLWVVTDAFEKFDLQYEYPLIVFSKTLVYILMYFFMLVFLTISVIGLFKMKKPVLFIVIPLSATLGIIFFALIFYEANSFFPTKVGECTVTDYGVFDFPEKKYPDGTTKPDYIKRKVIDNTDTIFAKIGTYYGFNYVIDGLPRSKKISVKMVVKYPGRGLRDAGRYKLSDTTYNSYPLGTLSYVGYAHSERKYLIEGKWIYELWYEDRLLVSKDFYVYVNK